MVGSLHRLDSPITVVVKEANQYRLAELPAGAVFNATGSKHTLGIVNRLGWSSCASPKKPVCRHKFLSQ